MKSKFLNKAILMPLFCGICCFTLTFLLTKGINHDEGKYLEITSRQKIIIKFAKNRLGNLLFRKTNT